MKQFVLAVGTLFLATVPAQAQTQSHAEVIARATLAAPPAMQADAMVIRMATDGSHEVLRDGSNGLMCWDRSDEPTRSFSVQCSSVENLDRVKQNRVWNMSGKTAEEIRAMRDAAEADGSREVSKFGSVYYTLNGEDADSANIHLTLAVPFATAESLGLPDQGSYTRTGSWIMEPGTTSAHLMLPGR